MTAMLDRPQPIAGPAPLTDEWHAWRSTGIGASEAAAACGLSRYETPLHVYARKTGAIDARPDNDAMRLGRKLEPVVISEFVERTGIAIEQAPCSAMRHPVHAFMLATPDALLAGEEVLECKTTSYFIARDYRTTEGTDHIPDEVVCQAQQQLAVTGRGVCHVATLVDGRTLLLHRVERNDSLIAGLVRAERELWERIVNRDPPEPNWEHVRTPDLMRELYGVASGKQIVLGDDVAAKWISQREIGQQIKTLENEREALRAEVLHAVGDAARAIFPGHEFELTRCRVAESTFTTTRKAHTQTRERKSRP